MTIVFQRVETPGIAQLSYLIGDDESRTAAVIDPRPDARIYVDLARRYGVAITHVFETHIHADFLSGSRSLVGLLGEAELCVSGEGGAEYGFDCTRIRGGDRFRFGEVLLKARHTPGHTPEHLAFEAAVEGSEDDPWGVFTGDSLFVGSAGRPDLLGEEQSRGLTEQLFRTLREIFLAYDDGVIIYPCHGAGSACGADIGSRPMSTIGYERRTNAFLSYESLDAFSTFVQENAPPEPHHYKRLKGQNAEGPPILTAEPAIPALSPGQFEDAMADAQLVDTRDMLAFGGGHIEGALNIGGRPELSVWAGQMLDANTPILLVVEDENDLERILWLFANVGLVQFRGHLAGGLRAWIEAGRPIADTTQVSVHELAQRQDEWTIVDVRSPSEWEAGRIRGSHHAYLAALRDEEDALAQLERDAPIAVYCGSGYRASLAASLLQKRGFTDIRNVNGSWRAWTAAGYGVER